MDNPETLATLRHMTQDKDNPETHDTGQRQS